jgi:membrane protein DedA with SNARE-associated domain
MEAATTVLASLAFWIGAAIGLVGGFFAGRAYQRRRFRGLSKEQILAEVGAWFSRE